MARLSCKCGAEMTNTLSPSPHSLKIFYRKEIETAIQANPDIRVWDLYSGWDEKRGCDNSFQDRSEPVQYWYCEDCKRVYEIQDVSCGKILRDYKPDYDNFENLPEVSEITSYREIIVLTDIEMDLLLSFSEEKKLSDYMGSVGEKRYYISENEEAVYVLRDEKQIVCVYREET